VLSANTTSGSGSSCAKQSAKRPNGGAKPSKQNGTPSARSRRGNELVSEWPKRRAGLKYKGGSRKVSGSGRQYALGLQSWPKY
jgi:hypothetical protein